VAADRRCLTRAQALLAYLFVFPLGLGFEGAPMSVVATFYVLVALLLCAHGACVGRGGMSDAAAHTGR
jgi:hypothetical protein